MLDKGRMLSMTESRKKFARPQIIYASLTTPAQQRALAVILRESTRLVRARRTLGLTGAQAISKLLKTAPLDDYGCRFAKRVKQVPLSADLIDEPCHSRTVDMLAALPPEEAAYYNAEENVVDYCGKCEVQFDALEQQYGFLGGTMENYIAYFNRDDLPSNLWKWTLQEDIKATAGFSVVEKKSGRQRKLLMQCAANYIWKPVQERGALGMGGGSCLSSVFCAGGAAHEATCDISNAFTAVRTPPWMWKWATGLPLRACDVWGRLSTSLQQSIRPQGWAC